jgi:tetratricopeptide (TPR) repeat protein
MKQAATAPGGLTPTAVKGYPPLVPSLTRSTAAIVGAGALLLGLAACARPPATRPVQAGVTAARADDWEAAVRHWTEAVRQDPGSAAARNNLAVAYEKRGDWDAADREYREALRLDPDNRAIRLNYEAYKARLEASRGGKG